MSSPASTSQEAKDDAYFPALDGLRLLCCASVVIGHSFVGHPIAAIASRLSGMGVYVFFSLSGFLITTLLLRELSKRSRVDLGAFYMRRVLRIFPVYYSALFLSLFLLRFAPDRVNRAFGPTLGEFQLGKTAWTHGLFLANWFDLKLPTTLDVLWSVSVEEQFYVMFPVTFMASARKYGALRSIVIGMVICFGAKIYLSLTDPGAIYRNTFATGDHLLLGALFAQILHVHPEKTRAALRRVGTLGEVLVFVLIIGSCFPDAKHFARIEHFLDSTASALVSTAAVALVAVRAGAISRFLMNAFVRKLGTLTYAGYVFHMYAVGVAWFGVAVLTKDVNVAAPLRALIALPLTFVLAWLCRITFEERILALKARWART